MLQAMGKLLFPRQAIDQWLADNSTGPSHNRDRPGVFLGSHDPLLEWALLESRCGIATFFDGSLDGLDRFEQHEGVAAGLHLFDPDETSWNVAAVANRFKSQDIVLVEWAERARGLIVRQQDTKNLTTLADLRRQACDTPPTRGRQSAAVRAPSGRGRTDFGQPVAHRPGAH